MVGFHVDSIVNEESNCNGIEDLQIQKSRRTSKNYNPRLDLSDYKISKDSITTVKKYKSYQCGKCRKIFNQRNYYQNHLRSHGNDNASPYSCNICGKSFSVPARLTRHFRTHTGEKPYQCEYCNKSFSVKENLSVHRRIHTKERPYKCNVCESAFEHSGKLHRHMRIHTGERPHKCSICNKTFIQSGQLVIHMRTHTGEKPYICKSCGKGFTCSKQLKVHTRTHTGEKPYKCEICDKSFGYNHVLKLHQVAHYGEKFYKCTICHETFNSKKSMEFHIRTHSDSSINNMKSSEIIFEKTANIDKLYKNGIFKNNSETANIEKTSNNIKLLKTIVETSECEYPKPLIYLNSKSSNVLNNSDESLNIHSFGPTENENLISEIPACQKLKINSEISTQQCFFTDLHANNNYTDKLTGKDTHKQYSLICDLQQNIQKDMKAVQVSNEQSYKPERCNVISRMHQNTLSSEISDETVQSTSDIKDNVRLPPRKRCKMILESMEIEQSNLTINERLNSVIRYARTEKI